MVNSIQQWFIKQIFNSVLLIARSKLLEGYAVAMKESKTSSIFLNDKD